jgi:hypothetical protein
MKRKKVIRPSRSEIRKQHEETQALLAARMAYHRAKMAEERDQREREAG